MLFNSYAFIVMFLPVVLAGWFALGRWGSHRSAQLWLIAASFFYYGWWNPYYLILLVSSMGFNYLCGQRIALRLSRNQVPGLLLPIGITVNLLALCYFKYAHFLLYNLNTIAGTSWTLHAIILPLAISFFTFQQIAYLVDIAKGKTRREDFCSYALFVCFFPQLIAGPIVHHSEMMPQFAKSTVTRINWTNLAVGITLFSMGLAKKVLLADPLSGRVGMYFGAAEADIAMPTAGAWYGVMAFALQIYFDFSGYTDMALGLAKMFNITLPQNFNSPYQANNIIQFWRRWHMTLSRFLRDYLYIPLGGNRHGKIRRNLNLMITMFLGGLWHGASWTFIIWGLLHGFYLMANHVWLEFKKRLPWIDCLPEWLRVAVARSLTLLAVLIAWVFFRAESFPAAINLFVALFVDTSQAGLFGDGSPTPPKPERWLWLLVLWGFALFVPNTQDILSRYKPALEVQDPSNHPGLFNGRLLWQPSLLWAAFIAIIFIAAFLSLSNISEFLYYNF